MSSAAVVIFALRVNKALPLIPSSSISTGGPSGLVFGHVCYLEIGYVNCNDQGLMTSLVNVLLNFQKLISQICQYFLLKKM